MQKIFSVVLRLPQKMKKKKQDVKKDEAEKQDVKEKREAAKWSEDLKRAHEAAQIWTTWSAKMQKSEDWDKRGKRSDANIQEKNDLKRLSAVVESFWHVNEQFLMPHGEEKKIYGLPDSKKVDRFV